MSYQPGALHQSGLDTIPIFPSKEYVSFPEEAVLREPEKHKFISSSRGVLYRPITIEGNQVISYEVLQIRQGTFEGNIQPFKNVGEHLNQALRTIQVENRKLIELVNGLGKEVEKF